MGFDQCLHLCSSLLQAISQMGYLASCYWGVELLKMQSGHWSFVKYVYFMYFPCCSLLFSLSYSSFDEEFSILKSLLSFLSPFLVGTIWLLRHLYVPQALSIFLSLLFVWNLILELWVPFFLPLFPYFLIPLSSVFLYLVAKASFVEKTIINLQPVSKKKKKENKKLASMSVCSGLCLES
jgi:hypothetical protein